MNKNIEKKEKFEGKNTTTTKVPNYFKYGVIVFAVTVIAVIAFGIYYYQSLGYVATVGGERVGKAEYSFYLANIKAQLLANAGENVDENTFWDTKIGTDTAIEWAKKSALEVVKDAKVQLIKAKLAGIKLEKADLDNIESVISNFTSQYPDLNKSELDQSFKQNYGVALNEFKEILKEMGLASKLKIKETTENSAWEDEVIAYYEKNPGKFIDSQFRTNTEEAVWARHILILTQDTQTGEELPADKQEEAKKKAEDVLARINNGEDFVTVAFETSQDQGSLTGGGTGDYVFGKGKMDVAFEKAAFELGVGQVSGLVKSVFGYHIIKLEEKIAIGQPVSMKCAKEYRDYVLEDKAYQNRIDGWKNEYKIETNKSIYDSMR